MWLILKSELQYTQVGLLIGFTIAVCFLLGAIFADAWSVLGLMLNTSIVFFISIGILGSEADKEKRVRIHASLPVRPKVIGLVEQYYVLLFQLAMVLLWLVYLMQSAEPLRADTFAVMLSVSGLVLALLNVFIFHTHLNFWGNKRYKLLIFGAVFVLMLVIFLLMWLNSFGTVWQFANDLFFSIAGSVLFLLFYLFMATLSIAAFVKRKSYLA